MKTIVDFHIHSKYSRACSKNLDLENLEKWARIKGIEVLGTGDFSHPKWIVELKKKLKDDGSGIFRTATGFPFVLQNEISLVFTQGGKGRRVHLLILAPNFDIVDKITEYLLTKGRTDYDGRPIFKISCIEFVKKMKEISSMIEVIPAHAWTPWFGIFGSKTGFDTLEEAFGEYSSDVHAIESGLSSDPDMNRMIKELDKIKILSFSDCHSFWPWRLGREATIMDLNKLTYNNIIETIRGDVAFETIEVDPSYGKYHFDGHRACNISMSPEMANKLNKLCPVCKKPLTIGVLNRVEELATRSETEAKQKAEKFYRIIPLHEIISTVLGIGIASKKSWEIYYEILKEGKNELDILLNVSEEELLKVTSKEIVEIIMMNRRGELFVKPGYDGEYGKLIINGQEILNEE